MAFSPALLERVRNASALSSLIGRYMPLKRHGREYTGLCPFHGEKTPSFTVNDAKGFFHCFGCAAHGDAIGFVERYERISWREAVEKIAREAGIVLEQETPAEIARAAVASHLHEAMDAACRWFEQQLAAPQHYAVRDYLQRRQLSDATCRQFRLGYAPDAREGLKRHLLSQGFAEALLVEAGLLIQPEQGVNYDRFRARLMFPIREKKGRVIAFGGRLMADSAHAPKYLNSPETPLFKKGEVLFNLDQAGNAAREHGTITIVEGYMDAIAMVQAGFPQSVATLGTAVTEAHLKALWRIAREPVLCLDGDAAGQRASLRAAELALPLVTPEHGLRFAFLPQGEDPDSLLKRDGKEALATCLERSLGLAETLWRHHARNADASAEGQASLKAALNQLAAHAAHPIIRNAYGNYFREQMWQRWDTKKTKGKTPTRGLSLRAPTSAVHYAMRQALALVLASPNLLHEAEVEHHLSSLECEDAALDALRQALLEAHGGDLAVLRQLHAKTIASLPMMQAAPDDAKLRWQHLMHVHGIAMLEAEHNALQHQVSDEESYARMLNVQEQLKTLKRQELAEAEQ